MNIYPIIMYILKLYVKPLFNKLVQVPFLILVYLMQKKIQKKKKLPIDESIYSKNRCYRLNGHHKGDEHDRLLIPIDCHQNYPIYEFATSYIEKEGPLDIYLLQVHVLNFSKPINNKYCTGKSENLSFNK